MNPRCFLILLSVTIGIASTALATDFGSYIPGTTGLKGGSVPPPGVYPVSFEFAYRTTDFRDRNGERITQVQGQKFSGKAEAPLTAVGISYVTDLKVFGANYGVRIADIGAEASVERHVGPVLIKERQSGNVNLYIEPLNLSWHLPRFDLFTSYGVYAPVGSFRSTHDDPSTGSDRWSHLIGGGMTAFFDESKKWSLSIVPRYEISQRNMRDDFKLGQEAIFEWGIARTFRLARDEKNEPRYVVDVGPIGYVSRKITRDDGVGVTSTALSRGHGAGFEATVGVPKWQSVRFCLRFEQEFLVRSRPQGQLGILRVSVKF